MALNQNYHNLWFKSFRLLNTSGHRDEVQLSLIPNQNLPAEIQTECNGRSVNPYELLIECDRDLFNDHPVGTRFQINAKLTDREGSGLFFYTSYRWQPLEILKAEI